MKLKNYIQSSLIAATLCLPIALTQAAQYGPYIGAGFGQSDDDILNESSSSFKFFGGFNLTEHIGFELSYVDLGSFANDQLEQDGVAYEVIGYLPLHDDIDLFARAGFYDWTVSDQNFTNTGSNGTFGLGVNAQINEHLSFRAEYQSFLDVDGGDVDLYSASLSFHF